MKSVRLSTKKARGLRNNVDGDDVDDNDVCVGSPPRPPSAVWCRHTFLLLDDLNTASCVVSQLVTIFLFVLLLNVIIGLEEVVVLVLVITFEGDNDEDINNLRRGLL